MKAEIKEKYLSSIEMELKNHGAISTIEECEIDWSQCKESSLDTLQSYANDVAELGLDIEQVLELGYQVYNYLNGEIIVINNNYYQLNV